LSTARDAEERAESRPPFRILPRLSEETEFFWTAGSRGHLEFLRCGDCGYFVHPPYPRCPRCLSKSLAPAAVSGRARVAGYTINYHPWIPGFDPPYVFAVVEMPEQEGLRMFTNIVNCRPEDVRVGMEVEVVFEHNGDVWLPLFQPSP
jgi:uncharacterized OB-fold protein